MNSQEHRLQISDQKNKRGYTIPEHKIMIDSGCSTLTHTLQGSTWQEMKNQNEQYIQNQLNRMNNEQGVLG